MSTDPNIKKPRRPVRIGKYEVVKHIATGGMGAVYKARDTDLDRDVALKVLPAKMASDVVMLERIKREARNAAKLKHENIVTIYEFGEFKGTWFLALEYVEGIDLYDYISRKGRLEPEEARRITIQAALALQHAYQQGIVHRDIKPSNFLVTRKNDRLVVKMTDLGLSREAGPQEFRVTRDGSTVGTVDYMAPEQARDSSRADTRSDIYSLGCTLYHMLAGQPPFPEGGLTERLYQHVQQEPRDIRQFNPRASEALMAVLRRMLAKQPADRYQTPAELVKDLLDLDPVAAPLSDRDILAGLAFGEADVTAQRESRPAMDTPLPRRRTPQKSAATNAPVANADAADSAATLLGMPKWLVAAAVGALLLLALLAGLLVLRHSGMLSFIAHGSLTLVTRSVSEEHPSLTLRVSVHGAASCYKGLWALHGAPGIAHAFRTFGDTFRWAGNGVRPGWHRAA